MLIREKIQELKTMIKLYGPYVPPPGKALKASHEIQAPLRDQKELATVIPPYKNSTQWNCLAEKQECNLCCVVRNTSGAGKLSQIQGRTHQ